MKPEIRTAVFPVAGRGTRFLPATKASPKEMLPVVDKPLIQYAVEEALAAGAQRLVFVTGAAKRAIEDHFDSDPELEKLLESQGKTRARAPDAQRAARVRHLHLHSPACAAGLGHAVLCAEAAVGQEPFFVHLADDLIDAEVPCLKQMAATYGFHRGSVLGVEEVPRRDTDKYGIVEVDAARAPVSRIRSIVEKPKPDCGAVDARRGRPLRADCRPSSTTCASSAAGRAAKSSSPTASRACSAARPYTRTASTASASTAAASSVTCRPPWNTPCRTRA